MEGPKFDQFVRDLVESSLTLSGSKRHDYATEDVLANFKRLTKVAKVYKLDFSREHHYPLFMVLMKLDRVQNLLSQGRTPKNESLQDTMKDAVNYLFLTFACLVEEMEDESDKANRNSK